MEPERNTIVFNSNEEGLRAFAVVVAQLIREGIVIKCDVDTNVNFAIIKLTGGF